MTMALFGTLDVCLQFRNFRNIDLYHQGVYYLRAQVVVPESGASSTGSAAQDVRRRRRRRADAVPPSGAASVAEASSLYSTPTLLSSKSASCPRATRGSRDATQKERKAKVVKLQRESDAARESAQRLEEAEAAHDRATQAAREAQGQVEAE